MGFISSLTILAGFTIAGIALFITQKIESNDEVINFF